MADEGPTSTSNVGAPIRRAFTVDETASLRNRRQPPSRFPAVEAPSPSVRRRSSTFSDLALSEARKTFQSSTDDLLLPKPSATGHDSHDSSAWHSAPLAFALLPAIGGMLFKNGSSVITDVMLLGLAAIFLNWSVRLPWDWYHSAQSIRRREEYNTDAMFSEESEDDNPLSYSQTSLDEVPEEPVEETPKPNTTKLPAQEAATNELYTHEILALLSCFLFPLLGAYLLHTIRSQLSRPSEGLVSNYNLTIFLLASELRPMAHLVKLIQARTLHLQRLVNSNAFEGANGKNSGDVKDLVRRLEDLEARDLGAPEATEPSLSSKLSTAITTEVRRTLQPDLDALNRAVRRYEKRATIQAFQTESKLQELESRLNDAISLAAAAVNNRQRQRSFTGIVIEAAVLPLQALSALARLPFKTLNAIINFRRTKVTGQRPSDNGHKGGNSRNSSHSRVGDRLQGRVTKR